MSTESTLRPPAEARLQVDTSMAGRTTSSLVADALRGLTASPKSMPAKYFYDDEGSRLFDAICDTPEYYPTRTEAALLESVADQVMAAAAPSCLVELGSGAARKTRTLLEALHRVRRGVLYVPMDVSEGMLRESATTLLRAHPWLTIHGIVGDYHHTLARLPDRPRRLVAFLGGTIGNFQAEEAVAFLTGLRRQLRPGDHLLLGTDLVKDPAILDRAYNDAAGVTAAFNKNLLAVLNRELGADFDLDAFEHLAFFDPDKAQVEMHLRARRAQTVHVGHLGLKVPFAAGETLHTEISRKFTRGTAELLLKDAGFRLTGWYTPPDEWFALSLAAPD